MPLERRHGTCDRPFPSAILSNPLLFRARSAESSLAVIVHHFFSPSSSGA
jgi:hypothetical protein